MPDTHSFDDCDICRAAVDRADPELRARFTAAIDALPDPLAQEEWDAQFDCEDERS